MVEVLLNETSLLFYDLHLCRHPTLVDYVSMDSSLIDTRVVSHHYVRPVTIIRLLGVFILVLDPVYHSHVISKLLDELIVDFV